MKLLKFSLLVFAVVFFTSCDCLLRIRGIVVDTETQLPMTNVMILEEKLPDSIRFNVWTDSLGRFEYVTMRHSLLGWPKISLTFKKNGYVERKKRYTSWDTDTVVVALKQQR